MYKNAHHEQKHVFSIDFSDYDIISYTNSHTVYRILALSKDNLTLKRPFFFYIVVNNDDLDLFYDFLSNGYLLLSFDDCSWYPSNKFKEHIYYNWVPFR